jgi:hypothetical protein
MTMPIAAPIHTYALECLICGATPDQVPDLHHGSDLNNLQAHMMEDHGFTWDDWQTPDRMAKTETRRPDGAVVYVWTRTSDALPYMRAVQTAVETAPSGDTLYLDIASPSHACWDWHTDLVHLTDPAQGNSVTLCGLAVNGTDLPWFNRTQPYLAASDMCGACHDLAIGRQFARAVLTRIDAPLAESALDLAHAGIQPLAATRYAHALRRRLDSFTLVQEHGRRAQIALALGPDGARVVVAFPKAASTQPIAVALLPQPLCITPTSPLWISTEPDGRGWNRRADRDRRILWTGDAADQDAEDIIESIAACL